MVLNVLLTPGGNVIANPGGSPADGAVRQYRLKQPASGGAATVTLGSAFVVPAGTSLLTSSIPNATDLMAAVWVAPQMKWFVVSYLPGYL